MATSLMLSLIESSCETNMTLCDCEYGEVLCDSMNPYLELYFGRFRFPSETDNSMKKSVILFLWKKGAW